MKRSRWMGIMDRKWADGETLAEYKRGSKGRERTKGMKGWVDGQREEEGMQRMEKGAVYMLP